MTKTIAIAGTNSGVGKTTVSIGLMGALARSGLSVQPFKSGPDYIDPSYHTLVTGVPSRNLDTWMLGKDSVTELYQRAVRGKDIAVIEGVMGLYDGRYSTADDGSTAELAKLVGAAVILVIDSRSGARSVAAVAKGFRDFDPDLNVAGVLFNGIGSEGHYRICREAVEHYTGLPVVGYLPRREDLVMQERHLGLIPMAEDPVQAEFFDQVIGQCQETIDIEKLLEVAGDKDAEPVPPRLFPAKTIEPKVKIGIARDRAFSFYYQDGLDLLEAWGAELVPFSPIHDAALPGDISGLYLGGGFPELYASELSENMAMKRAIREAVDDGMPVFAECGGYMYLGESVGDFDNNVYHMADILPVTAQIRSPKLSLGYRTVEALDDNPLMRKGESVRGHEFHWSTLISDSDNAGAFRVLEKDGLIEGHRKNNLLASYIHIHFGSDPKLAPRFVENCAKYRSKK